MACVVLHNILMKKDPWNKDDYIYEEQNENETCLDFGNNQSRNEAEVKRNALSEIINAMKI